MQTIQLKYNVISWITGLEDRKVILKLHKWVEEQKSIEAVVPPERKGSLTEGYGIWADDAPFDETNYRDQLWQTQKNAW